MKKLKTCTGTARLRLQNSGGTLGGKAQKKKYFLCNRKIYSRRFTTDCFSDYFSDAALKSQLGLADYEEYATEKASIEELKMQNSYFIGGLYGKGG